MALDDAAYDQLARLREGLREYLAWAEQEAQSHGLTPAQVQLMLAVRAHADPQGPTLKELAAALLLRHHSVVGLVDRAQDNGLVERRRDPDNETLVHVQLTTFGRRKLQTISRRHVSWLSAHGPAMGRLWAAFDGVSA